ncbi:single-strand DNA-binding protein [Cytobacillus horneckiae]|uniref:single-stranded DNA-binding protein n=1 Tax=Cytobacillus horneckiae TaxID=549687 RepID=UPI001F1560F6|nr:single-stranded DNA-binding protein [Cytobacillus horneckiae]
MNVITLTGNAVRDIEIRYTPNGKTVANGTIAVRRDFKNQQGEYETDFFNFVALGGLSEVMANHIKKGDKFGITGRLQIRKWEKDGKTTYFTEVVVNGFDFPTKASQGQGQQQRQPQNDTFQNNGHIDIDSDDLPF